MFFIENICKINLFIVMAQEPNVTQFSETHSVYDVKSVRFKLNRFK